LSIDPRAATAAVTVPATTANLGPGFDAFGAALSLRMTVAAVPRADERVASTGAGSAALASGDDNLVWSSLLAACDRFGWDVPDVSLYVDTPIPQARGLGSSSAAIVGGLAIARVLAEADASVVVRDHAVGDVALVRLAAELEGHPDNVGAAIHGGLVACGSTDDGELVVRLPDDVEVTGTAAVGMGDVDVLGQTRDGIAPSLTIDEPSETDAGVIDLDLDVGLGSVEVTR
jgi:homoserine kinase